MHYNLWHRFYGICEIGECHWDITLKKNSDRCVVFKRVGSHIHYGGYYQKKKKKKRQNKKIKYWRGSRENHTVKKYWQAIAKEEMPTANKQMLVITAFSL